MLKRTPVKALVSPEWIVPQLPPAPKVTPQTLKRAARLSKEIESLRRELQRLLEGTRPGA